MKNYKIAVAGTGYVGLSLGVLFAQHHQVVAVDIVQAKVDMINNKKSPIQDDYIEKYLAEKDLNLTATLDAKAAYSDADFVVIAAPTNYDSKTQHFDTSAVEAVIKLVMEYNPNAIMVIKSTIPVGYTASVRKKFNSQVYIGNLVTGKTRTASYKGIGLHPVDKEEWHIVENAHEAIILKSDFEIVQEKRNRNKEKRNNAMARSEQVRAECRNHFAGMVFCGCCRRNMTFVRQVHKTEEESYFGVFQCKRKKGTTPCSYHTVPEKMLMMVAMKQIHHLVSTMCEEEKMVKEMLNNGGLDSTRSIKVKENSIAFRIQETEERRLRLYEDYKAEILDEEEYSQLKEHYIAEKQRLEHELQKQRQRSLELEKRMRICDEQMERMRAILNQKEFDEELVHELIKKIYVGIDNSVEIEFKCSDPYQEVLAFVAEVQNE